MNWTKCALLLGSIAFAFLCSAVTLALAGPGHDHGPEATAVELPSSPRVVAETPDYELVGILQAGELRIYLDRRSDTSPVTDAKIELTIGDETRLAEPALDGTYLFRSPILKEHGDHEVIASVTHAGTTDLLVGVLKDTADHGAHAESQSRSSGLVELPLTIAGFLKNGLGWGAQSLVLLAAGLTLLCLGAMVGWIIGANRARRSKIAGSKIAAILLAFSCAGVMALTTPSLAGPGHDHGEGQASAANGDAPRRLPDGEMFLPKPTQRLLEIRTRVIANETTRKSQSLIGRIIPDPNRSGLVQSTIGGRIKPTGAGLPTLGQHVQAGDVLAQIEPAFAPIDASDVRQTAGDLEQRIAVLDARISRRKRLVEKEIASRAELEDLAIERQGLEARRQQLLKARTEPELLRAPVSGVVADINVTAGQVVSSGTTLIRLVDPKSLWVEAASFDPMLRLEEKASARARTSDGKLFDLAFIGRSRALQQQAAILHFRVLEPNETLNVGTPVQVLIESGAAVTGVIIPRNAIAQAPNGQMVVFKRLEPERYLPKAISFEDLDGERVHVTGGIAPGDQIIVRNAPLVSQIR